LAITYAPNQEKDVVLGCGCLDTWAFAIRVLGTGHGKWWQSCPNKHIGPGRDGLQPIIREATHDEAIRFYREGISATVRRTRTASERVRKVPGKSKGSSGTERHTSAYDEAETLW
jgi:hypothetical protein